jgi:hypothetical protein
MREHLDPQELYELPAGWMAARLEARYGTARQRAHRGARAFDLLVSDWWTRVDPDKLNVASGECCPAGQLFAEASTEAGYDASCCFDYVVEEWQLAAERDIVWGDVVRYGLMNAGPADNDELNVAWQWEIQRRRDAADRVEHAQWTELSR